MTIKLKTEVFDELTKELTDTEISRLINISTTQLWRVRLPDNDPRHNDPGTDFVAGTLRAFPHKKFEDLFFLAVPLRARKSCNACQWTGTDGK